MPQILFVSKRPTPLKVVGMSERPDTTPLAPFQESAAGRAQGFFQEAIEAHGKGIEADAFQLMERGWLVAPDFERYFPDFRELCLVRKDVESFQCACRRLAFSCFQKGDYEAAFHFCRESLNAYPNLRNSDEFSFDHEVLFLLREMARRWVQPRSTVGRTVNKVRVALLMYGWDSVGNVFSKIYHQFARFSDRSTFETFVVAFPNETLLMENPVARSAVDRFRSLGWRILYSRKMNAFERIIDVIGMLGKLEPDVILTTALLADPAQFFLVNAFPQAAKIGLVHGPPPQFSAPGLDWAISYSKHCAMDTPVNCSVVPLEFSFPEMVPVKTKLEFFRSFPKNGKVILCAGRSSKFQSDEFWRFLFDLLNRDPRVFLLVVGPRKNEIEPLRCLSNDERFSRVGFVPWTAKFQEILTAADIVIDTYPSGGGMVLMDAMASGIPCVSFRNNYHRRFNQMDWNPAEEIIPVSELVVPRGDFPAMGAVVTRLLADNEWYAKISAAVSHGIREKNGNPARMVRRCEQIMLEVFRKKRQGDPQFEPENQTRKRGKSGFSPLIDRVIQILYHLYYILRVFMARMKAS
ncbi:MAG: glycosyltransferase family 4 protein [Candidatus Riflebacteria bacterium]|nr:glycosyltransferase family 4 protein [Candidatus Riflebacteria bacterium]